MRAEESLSTLSEIAERHGLASLGDRCRTATEQMATGTVTVAVLGRFKAGKSTLLNALLGADVLPVQAIPATAVITRVQWGPVLRVQVTTTDRGSFEIPPADLGEWATESLNPGNRRRVDRIDVESPQLHDFRHLVLVDTPGTGSSWQQNTETSLAWLPHVGAALILVNATQPLADDDLRLIDMVRPHTPNIIIGLSKVDLLSAGDESQVEQHVHDRLREATGLEPRILPLAAGPSGQQLRQRLWDLLRDLDRSHSHSSASLGLYRSSRLIHECREYLQLERAAATARQEAIEALRAALSAEAARLPELRSQTVAQLQPIFADIAGRTEHLTAGLLPGTTRRMQVGLDREQAGWHSSLAAETSRFQDWVQAALVDELSPVSGLLARAVDGQMKRGRAAIGRIGQAFVQRLGDLVTAALGVPLDLPVPEPRPAVVGPVDVVIDTVFDSHLELLSWAVPMTLVRPLVHRHFQSQLPWQVQKNLERAGFRAAAAARGELVDSVDEYIGELAGIVANCRNLVDGRTGDPGGIDKDLATLDTLTGESLPELSRDVQKNPYAIV